MGGGLRADAAVRRVPWWAPVLAVVIATAGPVGRVVVSGGSVFSAGLLVAGAVGVVAVLGPGRPVRSSSWVVAAGVLVVLVISALVWREGLVYPWIVTAATSILAFGATIRWSILPNGPQRSRLVVGPATGLLVVSGWSWYRTGSVLRSAVVSVLCVLVLELWARRHSVADQVDAAVARVVRTAGDGVGTLLAWVVFVLVVMPVHLVSRLVGYSPLSSGRTSEASTWIGLDDARAWVGGRRSTSPESMAGPELRPTPAVRRRSWARWLPVVAVGSVALLLLGPWSIPAPWSGDAGKADADGGTFTRAFEEDPAFADAPWAANVRLSLLDAWNNLEFNAALGGWSIRDLSSEYVNVTDGERSTLPPDPSLGQPIEVWLLGASAAFGAGQRDEHTIASELVRRAGRDGLPLRVRNLAVPATVNFQTVTQLTSRLLWDDPPDLVVVYDGANDLTLQETLDARGLGDSDRPASLVDEEFDRILRERASERGDSVDLPAPSTSTGPAPELTPEELADRVVTRYGRGVELIRRSAAAASVPVVFFWQPDLRSKVPRSDVDRSTLSDVGMDESSVVPWLAMSDRVRSALPGLGVEDLTSVYDGRTDPIYWDTVHTNETGSAIVADAVYERLRPELQAALDARGG